MSDTRAVFTVTIADYDPDVVKVLRHVAWGLENVGAIPGRGRSGRMSADNEQCEAKTQAGKRCRRVGHPCISDAKGRDTSVAGTGTTHRGRVYWV